MAVDTRHTGNDSQREEECKQRICKVSTEGTSKQIMLAFPWCQKSTLKYFRGRSKLITHQDLDSYSQEWSGWRMCVGWELEISVTVAVGRCHSSKALTGGNICCQAVGVLVSRPSVWVNCLST